MTNKLWLSVSILLLLAAAGCTKDVRDPNKQAGGLQPSPGQSASDSVSPFSRAKQDGPRTNGKVDVDYLKMNLKPGLSQQEVLDLFGTGFRQVQRPDTGTAMWRFDFADVGYQFQATGATAGTSVAQADLDGLRKGMAHMQMFVGWDGDTGKSSYSELYYVDDTAAAGAHKVRLYTVYPDGKTTDQEIFAR